MRYAEIKQYDVANTPNISCTVFFTGCVLNCKGCFNKKAQNFNYGFNWDSKREEEFIWDKEKNRMIIYIDPCIDKKSVLDEIAEAFEIGEYVTASDFHYHCKNCSDALFDDMDW